MSNNKDMNSAEKSALITYVILLLTCLWYASHTL